MNRISDELKRKIQTFLQKNRVPVSFAADHFARIAGGGSDRCFYRIQAPDTSYILMVFPTAKQEVATFIDVGTFLLAAGIGVPKIFAVDSGKRMVLLEDLGDDSLYRRIRKAGSPAAVAALYQQALVFLAEMQVRTSSCFARSHYLKNRSFGYEALRWETDYFMDCFVEQFCGMPVCHERSLETEFNRLALELDREPKYFMHRDFQSQNIHFKNGIVKVIDFQTATRGLLQYDLASLLKDAYVEPAAAAVDNLLAFYLDLLTDQWKLEIDPEAFIRIFHLAGLQRNMQALGAFAFLSRHKGRKAFAKHIPAGLRLLQQALKLLPDFPALQDTVAAAGHRIRRNRLVRGG